MPKLSVDICILNLHHLHTTLYRYFYVWLIDNISSKIQWRGERYDGTSPRTGPLQPKVNK